VLRLRRLASRWSVSQAEVVRRSVEHADKQSEPKKPDPVAMLRAYHAKGGLSPARADRWIAEIREDRNAMIAGTAIAAGARLATNNRDDFEPFITHGLKLV